jgi:erythromycin esterase-like protein
MMTAASALLAQTPSPPPSPSPSPSSAQAAQAAADRTRLAETIVQAIKPLRLADGKLRGDGGGWLAGRLAGADIVMVGETHGSGSIAQTVGTMVDALPTDRPLAYVLEMSPTGALTQEPMLRGRTAELESYMSDPRRAINFAFLNLREEADLARKVIARSNARSGALWGIDQEFAPSAPMLLDRLGGWATTRAQKTALAAARGKSGSLMALTNYGDDIYRPLAEAFARGPKEAQTLIADMRLSSEIYRLQDSAANLSNRMREDYMKRNFLTHWRAAGKKKPRLVLKFGAYHLTAGLSPTSTPSLGSFVHALALMEGKTTFSVMVVCGPDGEQIDFRGAISGCREDYEATAGMFYRYLATDGPTLIDTAPLRLISGTLRRQGVSEDMRNYINSYDAIIVLKGAKAAKPFARPLPAFFEGM